MDEAPRSSAVGERIEAPKGVKCGMGVPIPNVGTVWGGGVLAWLYMFVDLLSSLHISFNLTSVVVIRESSCAVE